MIFPSSRVQHEGEKEILPHQLVLSQDGYELACLGSSNYNSSDRDSVLGSSVCWTPSALSFQQSPPPGLLQTHLPSCDTPGWFCLPNNLHLVHIKPLYIPHLTHLGALASQCSHLLHVSTSKLLVCFHCLLSFGGMIKDVLPKL